MITSLIFFSIILIRQDFLYRSVPIIPLLLFCLCWISICRQNPHLFSAASGIILVLSCWGIEYLVQRPLLGTADKILLPVILLGISVQNLGDYFIAAGVLGILFAFVWRHLYSTDRFPFVPALIMPAFWYLTL